MIFNDNAVQKIEEKTFNSQILLGCKKCKIFKPFLKDVKYLRIAQNVIVF